MHVFISYSHEDLDFAQNVKHELERRGFPVWIDELTPAGDDWRQDIEEALRNAFAVVLILTPSAMQSHYVTYEWAFALGSDIAVIPLLRKQAEFHARLDRLQHLDFTTSANRPWDQLAERLTTLTAMQESRAAQESIPSITLESLAEDLRSRQADTRNAAIKLLKRMKNPNDMPLLHEVLYPTQPGQRYTSEVRRAAIDALGNMGETALTPLMQLFDHVDKNIRFAIGSKLVALGDIAVPELLKVLDSSNVDARVRVTWILGEIGSPAAVDKLVSKLEDHDLMPTYRKRVSDGAADALISIGTPEAMKHAAAYWETQLTSKRKHWGKEQDMRMSDYAAAQLLAINTPAARKAVERWRREQEKEQT